MSSCDIIIPIWNQLKATDECVNSVRKNTRYPYRLIVIDNGSSPETEKYLKGLKKSDKAGVTLLRNEKNEGFVKAVNAGIRLSAAEYLCILNNDTIVTGDWLGEMVKLFDEDLRIGIVNPSSNTLGQKLPCKPTFVIPAQAGKATSVIPAKAGIHSRTLDSRFRGNDRDGGGNDRGVVGQSARRSDRKGFVELGSAFGFCMLMRRKLFDEIGLFDEVYGMGNFEDTDFSLRAKEKGYRTVRAFRSYVYHKESRSFNLLRGFRRDFERNKQIFESKWGRTKRAVVVFKDLNTNSLNYLRSVLKEYAKAKSWAYVICPAFDTGNFFENFSNLTFYHYRRLFYLSAFLKILFKKKKPDVVYCDNKLFSDFLKVFKLFHNADIKRL